MNGPRAAPGWRSLPVPTCPGERVLCEGCHFALPFLKMAPITLFHTDLMP